MAEEIVWIANHMIKKGKEWSGDERLFPLTDRILGVNIIDLKTILFQSIGSPSLSDNFLVY
jgi:hypothetical protein